MKTETELYDFLWNADDHDLVVFEFHSDEAGDGGGVGADTGLELAEDLLLGKLLE